MNKIEQLTTILEKLNSGDITEDVREEALSLVANIDPLELSLAEQQLIEKGLRPEDLRNLCDIHMEVLKDELAKLKTQVEKGHVLHTFIEEHDEILKFLTNLESLNHKIQKINTYVEASPNIERLQRIATNLLSAEKHHQREEDVLFRELEKKKITGPTLIMKMEHDELRVKKHQLNELAFTVDASNFNDFKLTLDKTAKYITFNLRDHIFKENYILYPSAMKAIMDRDLWNKMKKDCDTIGYCIFTPKNA